MPRSPITHVDPFFVCLGAILASNDLIYLILIPMLIAKNHSEKMAQNFRFQRICYAGTIAGVVLALCTVGKFLFSTNLASFLDFLSTPKEKSGPPYPTIPQDIIAVILLLIANLFIFSPIKREFI